MAVVDQALTIERRRQRKLGKRKYTFRLIYFRTHSRSFLRPSIHEFLQFCASFLNANAQQELRAIILDMPASALGAPPGTRDHKKDQEPRVGGLSLGPRYSYSESQAFRILVNVHSDVRSELSASMLLCHFFPLSFFLSHHREENSCPRSC